MIVLLLGLVACTPTSELTAYNGFVVPAEITVGKESYTLEPGEKRVLEAPVGKHTLTSRVDRWLVTTEEVELEPGPVVWNVAARGIFGPGETVDPATAVVSVWPEENTWDATMLVPPELVPETAAWLIAAENPSAAEELLTRSIIGDIPGPYTEAAASLLVRLDGKRAIRILRQRILAYDENIYLHEALLGFMPTQAVMREYSMRAAGDKPDDIYLLARLYGRSRQMEVLERVFEAEPEHPQANCLALVNRLRAHAEPGVFLERCTDDRWWKARVAATVLAGGDAAAVLKAMGSSRDAALERTVVELRNGLPVSEPDPSKAAITLKPFLEKRFDDAVAAVPPPAERSPLLWDVALLLAASGQKVDLTGAPSTGRMRPAYLGTLAVIAGEDPKPYGDALAKGGFVPLAKLLIADEPLGVEEVKARVEGLPLNSQGIAHAMAAMLNWPDREEHILRARAMLPGTQLPWFATKTKP